MSDEGKKYEFKGFEGPIRVPNACRVVVDRVLRDESENVRTVFLAISSGGITWPMPTAAERTAVYRLEDQKLVQRRKAGSHRGGRHDDVGDEDGDGDGGRPPVERIEWVEPTERARRLLDEEQARIDEGKDNDKGVRRGGREEARPGAKAGGRRPRKKGRRADR